MKLADWGSQKINCSIDDTLWIFKDITEHKEYVSIFENPILKTMKKLHLKFGGGFTCYCFYNAWYNFTLADSTERFTKEFEENANWLKFGFHGYGFDESGNDRTYESVDSTELMLKDYMQITKELCRITSEKNLAQYLRLSSFKGSREGIGRLKKEGIKGFLCAETMERESYYLDEASKQKLYSDGKYNDRKLGVEFLPTWLRMEKEESIEEKLDYLIVKKFPIVVFTHECAIMDDEQKIWSNFEKVFERVNRIERKIRFF